MRLRRSRRRTRQSSAKSAAPHTPPVMRYGPRGRARPIKIASTPTAGPEEDSYCRPVTTSSSSWRRSGRPVAMGMCCWDKASGRYWSSRARLAGPDGSRLANVGAPSMVTSAIPRPGPTGASNTTSVPRNVRRSVVPAMGLSQYRCPLAAGSKVYWPAPSIRMSSWDSSCHPVPRTLTAVAACSEAYKGRGCQSSSSSAKNAVGSSGWTPGMRSTHSAMTPTNGHSSRARASARTVERRCSVTENDPHGEGCPCQLAGSAFQPNSETQMGLESSPQASIKRRVSIRRGKFVRSGAMRWSSASVQRP